MIYRAIGLMSGSSLDGLDLVFAEFLHQGGTWSFEIKAADCLPYSAEWSERLRNATSLSAREYARLHADYGHFLGRSVNEFMEQHQLLYQIGLVSSHGHTTFHDPASGFTAQLGDGAAIAAETGLPVVSDLRNLDVAFGGQGAPIVPMGEKLLLREYSLFLNIGGIANLSINGEAYHAYDVCPANRVLNHLANGVGKDYDEGGALAATGTVNEALLNELNELPYYQRPFPKSLDNEFGIETIIPMIGRHCMATNDALRTYVEHIAVQVAKAVAAHPAGHSERQLLVTGGGALNRFLVNRLDERLRSTGVTPVVPDTSLVQYKEALIMAFLGVLRWRQENTVLASVTGASRDSIGGAVWIGQEA